MPSWRSDTLMKWRSKRYNHTSCLNYQHNYIQHNEIQPDIRKKTRHWALLNASFWVSHYKPILLSVVTLYVAILSAMAPIRVSVYAGLIKMRLPIRQGNAFLWTKFQGNRHVAIFSSMLLWRYDTQHNNIRPNDTQHNGTQYCYAECHLC
jgi:hypothetical protein